MRVIRRHFLAAVVDPAVSLSTYSILPMEFDSCHIDHAAPRAPRRWTMARPRKGTTRSREDAAVEDCIERSMRVHWFGCV